MRIALIIILMQLFASSAYSFAKPEDVSIVIDGNERTKSFYIEGLTKECLKTMSEMEDSNSQKIPLLNQCLMNAKIFAKVETDIQDNRVLVRVEEKWTLIPAPFYQSSGKTRKGGLIVFETNFLGQGLTLAMGANASNRGSGIFGFFSNPSLGGSNWFSNLSFAKETNQFELIEKREKVSYSFLEKHLGGQLSLGYRFDWFNLSGNLARIMRRYEEVEDYLTPTAYSFNRAGFTFEYDKRDYKLYFSDGFYARYRHAVSSQNSDSSKRYVLNEGTLSWQHDIYRSHALNLQMTALNIKGGRITDGERVGSTKGFRGIEAKTAFASSYFTQSVDYQIPVYHLAKGTMTTAVFFDHGKLMNRGGNFKKTEYNSSGTGVYYYFSTLAIPGFGLELGSNSAYQKSFVNFSIGMSY